MKASSEPEFTAAIAELSDLGARQGGVVSRRQALGAGLSTAELATRVRTGQWRRTRAGAYQVRDDLPRVGELAPDEQVDLAAALLRHVDSVVSHESAARFWGLPLLGDRVTRTVSRAGTRPRTPDPTNHGRVLVSTLPTHHVCRVGDWLRITTPARTIADLARTQGVRAGIVAADHGLRESLCVREQLASVLSDCRLFPGAQSIATVVAHASPKAETPLESVSRYEIATSGLRALEEQVVIRDPRGRFVARVDFVVAGVVVCEADGALKYGTRADLVAEKVREDRLRELGYEVVRWTWSEIWSNPSTVIARIAVALERARRHRSLAS